MNKTYIAFLVLIGVIVVGFLTSQYVFKQVLDTASASTATNFEECAKVYPVMESYPRQCRTPDGKHFTEIIPNEPTRVERIANFEECVKTGGEIMESSPAQCRTGDNRIFTENASNPTRMETIANFEECAKAGYPVTLSYPRQCRSSEGKTFTEFTQ